MHLSSRSADCAVPFTLISVPVICFHSLIFRWSFQSQLLQTSSMPKSHGRSRGTSEGSGAPIRRRHRACAANFLINYASGLLFQTSQTERETVRPVPSSDGTPRLKCAQFCVFRQTNSCHVYFHTRRWASFVPFCLISTIPWPGQTGVRACPKEKQKKTKTKQNETLWERTSKVDEGCSELQTCRQ